MEASVDRCLLGGRETVWGDGVERIGGDLLLHAVGDTGQCGGMEKSRRS
jgi:hypothetical protein